MAKLTAQQILDQIHALITGLNAQRKPLPTHLLLDPSSSLILQMAAMAYPTIIDPVKLTVWHTPIIRVYQAHPFIALATVTTYEDAMSREANYYV